MKTGLVTGASRGIGKAIAIELATAGYDVAILARTVHEGEAARAQLDAGTLRHLSASRVARQHRRADPCDRTPVPVAVAADLLDHPSLERAADAVLGEWGRIDVLVNNGRYIGPGHMDRILDTPVQLLRDHLEANALAPVVLIKAVVPQMIERGGGTIIDITSTVAYEDPTDPAGEGGWGLGYAFSKGALHRIAGVLAVEQRDNNVRAYNVQPGFIATERIRQDMAAFGFDASAGAPAEVVGEGLPLAARVPRRTGPERAVHSSPGIVRRIRAAARLVAPPIERLRRALSYRERAARSVRSKSPRRAPRPGTARTLPRVDLLTALGAHANRVGDVAARFVHHFEGRALGRRPCVAPFTHRREHAPEVAALVGEPVLGARRVLLVGDPFQHTAIDEVIEPVVQDVAGDAEARLEVVEPRHAEERIAHDEHAPPLAHDLQALGDRAVHGLEAGPFHIGSLEGCFIELNALA